MASKKTSKSKRAALPESSAFTKAFVKDWKRLSHSGRYDMNRLKQAMLLLIANEGELAAEWLDHPLKGNWAAYRECHVGGDFLLIYQASDESINFVRAGTHADMFSA